MLQRPGAGLSEAALDALMDRLAQGDRLAFDALYAELQPRALRLAEARLGVGRGADVAQTALLKVFARASDFEPGRPCLPWFYAIVGNEVRAARRGDARLVLDANAFTRLEDEARDAESELVARELDRALEVALNDLDDDSARALAALLGRAPLPAVSAATFRKRVSRAYAKLRLLFGGRDVG